MFFLDFYRSVRRAVLLCGGVYLCETQPVHNGLGGLLGPRFCPRRSRGSLRGFERFREMPKAFLHSHLAATSLRDSSTRAARLKTVTRSNLPPTKEGEPARL